MNKKLQIQIAPDDHILVDEAVAWITSRTSQPEHARWTELAAYAVNNDVLCIESKHSLFGGETTRYRHRVCLTGSQIVEFFGDGQLANGLYQLPRMEKYLDY